MEDEECLKRCGKFFVEYCYNVMAIQRMLKVLKMFKRGEFDPKRLIKLYEMAEEILKETEDK